jgi:hypothetical protein
MPLQKDRDASLFEPSTDGIDRRGFLDTVDQNLKAAPTQNVFFVPGEHDVLQDDGKQYLARYGRNTEGAGWYSFDHKGVHLVGLVNVMNLKAGGMGSLGAKQLEWLEDDVKHLSKSTPVVVFAHMPRGIFIRNLKRPQHSVSTSSSSLGALQIQH